jgi:hypothetical protein
MTPVAILDGFPYGVLYPVGCWVWFYPMHNALDHRVQDRSTANTATVVLCRLHFLTLTPSNQRKMQHTRQS